MAALAAEADPPTTVREPAEALDVHVADSLTGLQEEALRSARRVADIGAGAGFPGLVLAVALPGAQIDLVEAGRTQGGGDRPSRGGGRPGECARGCGARRGVGRS